MRRPTSAAVLVLALWASSSAEAATLHATGFQGLIPDFTIEFTDSNGNRLFDIAELTAWSGFVFGGASVVSLVTVPDFPGQTVNGTIGVGPLTDRWEFDTQGSNGLTPRVLATKDAWSVDVRGLPPAPVPVPAAAWLFASALGGLAWLRRR